MKMLMWVYDFCRQHLDVEGRLLRGQHLPDTCSSWQQRYSEFAERFMEASKKQLWGSADALAKYHQYRPYKRRVGVCLPARQKPHSEALRGLQGYFTGGVGGGELDDDFICEVI